MGLVEKFIQSNVKSEYEKADSTKKKMESFTKIDKCPVCEGKRYSKDTLSCKIMGQSIYDLTEMQLDELINVLNSYEEKAAAPIIKNITEKVQNIIDIGLDYINLNRETGTLSRRRVTEDKNG
jgi:excinuclease UvrABC ATPase subunit